MESIKVKEEVLYIPHTIAKNILVYIIIFIAGIYLGYKNYLLYHTIVEMFGAVISFVMAIISINTYGLNKNNRMMLLGVAFGFVACFNLVHIFTYKDIDVIGAFSFNSSLQVWSVGRYIHSISLFIYFLSKYKRYKLKEVFCTYALISVLAFIGIFYLDIFPDLYIEGIGFTNFRIVNGYINGCISLVALLYIAKKNGRSLNQSNIVLVFSIISGMVCQFCFIFSMKPDSLFSVLGHMFQLISFYCIYIALVQTSLKDPHYSLIELNDILVNKNQHLENLVDKLQVEHEKRREIENQSQKKQQILNGILESVGDGIKVIDDDRKILHVNEQYKKMVNIPFEATYETDDQFIDIVKEQLINAEEFLNNIEVERKTSGKYVHNIYFKNGKTFEIRSLPFIDNEITKRKLVVYRDITQRKEIEKLEKEVSLRQALLEKAQEFDELKTNFFCTVSHELKTPINIILGVIQLLSSISQDDVEHLKKFSSSKYINMMKQNCYRLIKLSNNLIDITKIDAGFTQVKLENHNIVSVIEDITLSVAEYTKSKGISLVFDTDIEEKIIACDYEKLERVILNLLSNAVKFTEPDGEIMVNIKDADDFVIISVEDNGIGIPENKKDIIFDRFRQVDSTLRRQQEGSGIGLALVKSIVEMHGGEIRVQSEEGKGSQFIIQLPVNVVMNNNTIAEIIESTEINVERISIEFSDIYELNRGSTI